MSHTVRVTSGRKQFSDGTKDDGYFCQVELDGKPLHGLRAVSFDISQGGKPLITLTLQPAELVADLHDATDEPRGTLVTKTAAGPS